jgi:hypothetical protein
MAIVAYHFETDLVISIPDLLINVPDLVINIRQDDIQFVEQNKQLQLAAQSSSGSFSRDAGEQWNLDRIDQVPRWP